MLTIWRSCTLQATGMRYRGLLLGTWQLHLLISINGSSNSVQPQQRRQPSPFTRMHGVRLKSLTKGRLHLIVSNQPTTT